VAKTRTFLDADVLINAFRGIGTVAVAAQAIVDDPDREFVASDILRLELIPKPHFFGRAAEEQFYEDFFAAAAECVNTTPAIVRAAEIEAKAFGLAAADAMHVAAAKATSVAEFVTAEKPTSAVFRTSGLLVTSLRK
jgi:predicted nucleic acid-binding protein